MQDHAEIVFIKEICENPMAYINMKVRITGILALFDCPLNSGILVTGESKIMFDMKYATFDTFSIGCTYTIIGVIEKVENVRHFSFIMCVWLKIIYLFVISSDSSSSLVRWVQPS